MRIFGIFGITVFCLSACSSRVIDDGSGTEREDAAQAVSRGSGPDDDGDGWYASTDCDDTDANVNPGEQEIVNLIDDDCDDAVDCDDSSVVLSDACYDGDGDGYCDDTDGDGDVDVVFLCDVTSDANAATIAEQTGGDPEAVTNYIEVVYGGEWPDYELPVADCDDADAESYPGGIEVCDDTDNDCDGTVDNDVTDAAAWYADTDGDGYGDPMSSTEACDASEGWVADATDCDDNDYYVNPGEAEVCDEVDNDCNGVIDTDSVDAGTWYADTDGDGYGDPEVSVSICGEPDAGWVADATDCDDAVTAVNPGAVELCNGYDDDCDGDTDNTATDMTAWYRDIDGDAFGDPEVSYASCDSPIGYINTSGDCDDGDDDINPDAVEILDGQDNDCNGDVDDVADGSCRITVDIFSGRSGPALTVTGSISDDASFSGSWIDGSVSTVTYTDTPLGGSDHQYTFDMNHCLGSGAYLLLDATWTDGKSLCNSDASLQSGTVYATQDTADLTVGYYDNGDGSCQLQIQ